MKVKVQMMDTLDVDAIGYWYSECGWRKDGFVLV
jgi:hypothetical protein